MNETINAKTATFSICIFCKEVEVTKSSSTRDAVIFQCSVCGKYELSGIFMSATEDLHNFLTTSERLNCTEQNIRDNEEKHIPIWSDADNKGSSPGAGFVYRYFSHYKDIPISHAQKPNNILKLMASKLNNVSPFEGVHFNRSEIYKLKINGAPELIEWIKLLQERGLAEGLDSETAKQIIDNGANGIYQINFQLTPRGWIEVEELSTNVNSRKAFLAMSFKNPERIEIQAAIEKACLEAGGWEPLTIDHKEYLGGITDEIIASINQSRFIIAEFTENNQGVYFEAGYAEGAKIPVISVVKKSQLDKGEGLHFDTRHINHIVWESFEDLTLKLKNRIRAIIRD